MGTRKITIGILAHVDAGKTTLSEALLYKTGEIRKPGRVDHGDSFLDDNSIERNRGITIFSRQARFVIGCGGPGSGGGGGAAASAADTANANDSVEVTLIDTPGHVDFAAEMERSLSVLDYALLVVSGSEGVQSHTKTLYRMLSERGIPVFIFINKMDISVTAKETIIDSLSSELGANAVDFGGAALRTEDFIDAVTLYSPELAEAVLESAYEEPDGSDAGLAEGRLSGPVLSDDQIAEAVIRKEIVPCVFGSALRFEGIDELLELIGRYTREPEYGSEFGARIYKVAEAEDGERLCFIKITGGELRVRDRVRWRSAAEHRAAGGPGASGSAAGGDEGIQEAKVNQIRLYSGSRCVTADSAAAGTVCAVTGLSRALPGDALGAEQPLSDAAIKPFMVYSVTGPSGMDPHELMKDLSILSAEDPSLNASWSAYGSGIEVRLMGQVQLEVLQTLIKDRFGCDVSFGSGSVLYLETINDTYEGFGHFEPLRHYAEVHVIMEPGERGSGIVITSEVPEDELAVNWQRLIMTHLEEKEHVGVLTGSPLTDVKISLAAGRAHDKHTVGGDFREATYRAVRNALMQAKRDGKALLLEPWCEYEIELPAQLVGRAMTDIRQMGGSQDGLEQLGDTAKIRGRVPAAEISGYQQVLTGYTSGAGRMSLMPDGYDICHNADEVIEESGYDPERDTDNPADSVFVNHSGSDIVKWDEAAEHMHIGSVLRRRSRGPEDENPAYSGGFGSSLPAGAGSGRIDAKEEARRRLAAEKELRAIFERTYGASKNTRHRDREETDYRTKPQLSEEEAARNAARNEEIRARHGRRIQMSSEKPVLILVDGYNLIFADPYLKELADRDAGSARDQLLERLCNYAGYTGCELAVVFDAYRVKSGTGHEEEYNGIHIIYTAENEPADIRMGKMTNEIKDRQVYVVSSDMLVQQDSWGHGALRVSSHEFIELLGRTEQEIRDRLSHL